MYITRNKIYCIINTVGYSIRHYSKTGLQLFGWNQEIKNSANAVGTDIPLPPASGVSSDSITPQTFNPPLQLGVATELSLLKLSPETPGHSHWEWTRFNTFVIASSVPPVRDPTLWADWSRLLFLGCFCFFWRASSTAWWWYLCVYGGCGPVKPFETRTIVLGWWGKKHWVKIILHTGDKTLVYTATLSI